MSREKNIFLSVLFIICASCQIDVAFSANILGIFTSHSPSHLIVHMSVAKALADKGHNVTVVASQMPVVKHDKIKVIIVPPTAEQERVFTEEVAGMALRKNNLITTMFNFFGSLNVIVDMQADILKNPRVTALYDNPDTKFDLVIVGFFMNNFQYGVAAKFKAPLIVSWSSSPSLFTDMMVGNPTEASFVPGLNLPIENNRQMNFFERMKNLVTTVSFTVFKELLDFRMRRLYKELFPNDGIFPRLGDMERNISLVFCNGHFSEGPIKPIVPAIVEIGGIQVKDTPSPLPDDIAKHLDSASKTGAILFSLGSNLKSSYIKSEISTHIFNVLSKLELKVIWKWEDLKNTPGKSPNILYKKWLPQDDILAHPNTKLFITHAGKGGVAEAQYHGVPMVALPVFADQHDNAGKIVISGFGKLLNLLTLTEEEFEAAIMEVLNNPKYTENVQRFSLLYRDRPLTAREAVVYWAEYVMRHHGAAHMQSPLVHMNFIQSFNLDVYMLFITAFYGIWYIIRFGLSLVCKYLCKRNKKTKRKSN